MKTYENFIAYRRNETTEEAEKIYSALISRGYTTFLDVEESEGGNYKSDFRDVAATCTNYLVILTETSFDRCIKDGEDLFGKGIEFALKNNKRVIPIFVRNFKSFPSNLPISICQIVEQNGCFYNNVYFESFIDQLVDKFLVDSGKVVVSNPERDFYIEGDTLLEYVGRATVVFIPDSVKKIADFSFKDNTKITKVIIPESVLEIGRGAFERCISIQNIVIPKNVIAIGEEAFSRCYNLVYIGLGESLKTIGGRAFSYCCKLKNIEIPLNVESIDSSVFNGCSMLKSISVNKKNRKYKTNNGILYDYSGEKIVRVPENYDLDYVDVPFGVKTICSYAFYRCVELQSINLPNTIEMIQEHAFEGCINATNFILRGNISSIEVNAFDGWSKNQITFSKDFSPRIKRVIEKSIEENESRINKNLFCDYVYIKTTFESKEEAKNMANMLVRNKYIASGQISRFESIYTWESKISDEEEYELSCITASRMSEKVKSFIDKNHSYEMCQILVVPIVDLSKEIANWIEESLR